MPRQNRVNPFGELIATAARGTLMGNRGCLHDADQHIRRSFALQRWIICLLSFRGRHREVMTPGRYTELFFLDEATALAAGHRPCAECQRERYLLYREAWGGAGARLPSAEQMDSVLHAERLEETRGKRTFLAPVAELPPGAMVVDSKGVPFLVLDDRLARWSPDGYTDIVIPRAGGTYRVLTPPSTVRAIQRGYAVLVHSSATISVTPPG